MLLIMFTNLYKSIILSLPQHYFALDLLVMNEQHFCNGPPSLFNLLFDYFSQLKQQRVDKKNEAKEVHEEVQQEHKAPLCSYEEQKNSKIKKT